MPGAWDKFNGVFIAGRPRFQPRFAVAVDVVAGDEEWFMPEARKTVQRERFCACGSDYSRN
jgi:hypothetical protein